MIYKLCIVSSICIFGLTCAVAGYPQKRTEITDAEKSTGSIDKSNQSIVVSLADYINGIYQSVLTKFIHLVNRVKETLTAENPKNSVSEVNETSSPLAETENPTSYVVKPCTEKPQNVSAIYAESQTSPAEKLDKSKNQMSGPSVRSPISPSEENLISGWFLAIGLGVFCLIVGLFGVLYFLEQRMQGYKRFYSIHEG